MLILIKRTAHNEILGPILSHYKELKTEKSFWWPPMGLERPRLPAHFHVSHFI